MSHPTLGLLEKLRPPSGFRTEAALGATYSADLLTCMAVLTTMDGGDGEQIRYGRVEAYRALDRLRDKVRICYEAGRISRRDGAKYPSLSLLDRVLVPIWPPGRGAFHPKVWLVRQTDEANRERFVLIVSSRNVTMSTDWDLGVVLDGTPAGMGVPLPRVRAFVEHVFGLADDPGRLETFGNLDEVRWTLPPHVREMAFDFQAGSDEPRQLHAEWARFPPTPSRLLLLSPFIDAHMVAEAAARWGRVPTRRLVAGTEGLITVALGSKREALRALEPRQMVAASEVPDPLESETGAESEDETEDVRGLHAKVIAFDNGRLGTVVLGSNNLTGAGWCGGSTEAYVRLVGDAALSDPLWDWAGTHAQLFDFPDPGTPPPKQPILEQIKDRLHTVRFRLEDTGQTSPSRLVMLDPHDFDLPQGVSLQVARYTTPRDAVTFPVSSRLVEIPGCATALRTHFVVCTLRCDDDQTAWIAAADLQPPLGDERDHELVARLLGLREFLAYLQSLRNDQSITGTIEGDPGGDWTPTPGSDPTRALADEVHLEGLLRQMVADPEAFREMDRAVTRYGELIRKGLLSPDELTLLGRFLDAWRAIGEAFRQ